ncbi:cell wall metabolism sensor histidine kinase WalK [Actinokineospora sp. UTMC 2448]|uniref:sensor histidine kinase n=1 Tax=Actinokineospora sp. UTMC 2448 TaxID=2268449 RepID=UPI002164DB30|nr:HAMP domain-containing sensor histidine kinase [Actinokineospora sp. UTMC 2448]UVS77990.1 putative sensor histidine kinase TcrY [Actinokineospora sp. UTMC 2448]
MGLRTRITLLATLLVAVVSALLLWLGWVLAGGVVASVPSLPPGETVLVGGVPVTADKLADALADDARDRLLLAGSVAFVCVVTATALLSWVVTGRVLRPLREVTATAHRLSVESLGQRINHRGPRDEVAELAATFDAMLDRLQAAFAAQRQFVANASHELRTPLAVIRTELDVTLADPDASVHELRRMGDVARTATLKAGRLVEALLVLARTDGLGVGATGPVDLAAVVASAWRAIRAEADARAVSATFHTAPAPVIGDAPLLERVAGNLLENAVRHNHDGGWIEVRTSHDPQWSVLRVASSGAVVAPERVGELFEPFRRGGVDRTAQTGTGLGLSIVRAVVRAHGGRVTAEAVPGGGLVVTVRLPVMRAG